MVYLVSPMANVQLYISRKVAFKRKSSKASDLHEMHTLHPHNRVGYVETRESRLPGVNKPMPNKSCQTYTYVYERLFKLVLTVAATTTYRLRDNTRLWKSYLQW